VPTLLAEWFEKAYLQWQLDNGRNSLDSFAEYLGISRGYLSQILNGDKKSVGRNTATVISQKLNDYSLLDILGFAHPKEKIHIEGYPTMSKVLTEAFTIIRERGIEDDSPEAIQIISDIARKHGVDIKNLSSDK
jgi:hypothetical protein